VLVVDDDEGQRLLLAQTVAGLGFTAVLAADGEEALQSHSDQPAAVICYAVSPVFDACSKPFRILSIARDITERTATARQLAKLINSWNWSRMNWRVPTRIWSASPALLRMI